MVVLKATLNLGKGSRICEQIDVFKLNFVSSVKLEKYFLKQAFNPWQLNEKGCMPNYVYLNFF